MIPDVLMSDESELVEEELKLAKLKEEFPWALGEAGATNLICQLTNQDELIVDPFAGTALWGLIAAHPDRADQQ